MSLSSSLVKICSGSFFAYENAVSGGIVEFVSIVARQDPVGIAVVKSAVVVVRGVRDVVVTSRAMVGIMVVVR